MPVQSVFLLRIGDRLVAHELFEHVEIHGHTICPLGDELGEERPEPGKVFRGEVG